MKITTQQLEAARLRMAPSSRVVSGIDRFVAKHGWSKVVRTVADLRTALMDSEIDALAANLPADEAVEIEEGA